MIDRERRIEEALAAIERQLPLCFTAPIAATSFIAGRVAAIRALSSPSSTESEGGDPPWFPEDDEPINPGWYAVKRKDGSLCLRAFGNGMWWIPLKDGWLSGLPPGFRWMGPLADINWDTPRDAPPSSPAEEREGARCVSPSCSCEMGHPDATCTAPASPPPEAAKRCSECGGTFDSTDLLRGGWCAPCQKWTRAK